MRARCLVFALVALLLVPAASARFGMPEPLTERGEVMEDIYVKIFLAAAITFLIVFLLLAWIVYRYREGTGHGRATHEKERHSLKAEMVWTGIPLIVVLWVGVIAYAGLVELDGAQAYEEPTMEIKVVASQWDWVADYGTAKVSASPDGKTGAVQEANYFIVPADTSILWNLTSTDVIHAFHLMDANRATVHLTDANPAGPHKYNKFPATLPEGTYPVQCREMCLNPGHAYMRAVVKAVPRAEFDYWLEGRSIVGDATLVHDLAIQTTAAGVDVGDQQIVAGSRVRVEFTNNRGEPVTLEAPGVPAKTIAAGAKGWFAFDVPDAAQYTLQISGVGDIVFTGVEATAIAVDFGPFTLEPETLNLAAGTTYLITVRNLHTTTHNLFIGDYGGQVVAQSATIGGGATASFIFTPEETGTIDMWCNVPGHYGQGMHGVVHVE